MSNANEANTGGSAPGIGWVQNRWMQLLLGILCMALVANLQYAWTFFVDPIEATHHWGKPAIQTAFTIFIFLETWLVPVEGWLVDRLGPRPVIAIGAILAAVGWVLDSYADSLPMLYVASAISAVGAGCVYGTCVGNALKWFPDRRGLAAGLTAAGFGGGAALSVIPIADMIQNSGYERAFFFFGILQGVLILVFAALMVKPRPPQGAVAPPRIVATKVDYTTMQMLKTPVFWVLYAMFVAVAIGGLTATAQIKPIAGDYGFNGFAVSFLGMSVLLPKLTVLIDDLCNGLTRPICGFLSDRIGRENTMCIVFIGEGLAILGLMSYGHNPYAFMLFAALTFVFYGEIFSIFPATCGDTFGNKFASANAGALYTAKGTASIFVPYASVLSAGGNWNRVFVFCAIITIAAGIAAKLVLQPLRRRTIEGSAAAAVVA